MYDLRSHLYYTYLPNSVRLHRSFIDLRQTLAWHVASDYRPYIYMHGCCNVLLGFSIQLPRAQYGMTFYAWGKRKHSTFEVYYPQHPILSTHVVTHFRAGIAEGTSSTGHVRELASEREPRLVYSGTAG